MSRSTSRTLGLMALVAVAAAWPLQGCSVEEYCIDCLTDDGGGDGDGRGRDGMGGDDDGGDGDSGMPPDACVSTGVEQCDGLDNDCNGQIDDGNLPQVGDPCGSDEGECAQGTWACTDGALDCVGGVEPVPELCDGLDNDCVFGIDNGDPEGGVPCGTNQGECIAGIQHCVDGAPVCSGNTGPTDEACDGKDNDCDTLYDEDIPPLGSCGATEVGACELGTLQCSGGVVQCVGAVGPTLELCDSIDQDCDGNPTNGYDLTGDVTNCGTCGHVCSTAHAISDCVASNCDIAACVSDYWDVDGAYGNGCEYGPCVFQGPQEACNHADDDCDSNIDENLQVPTNLCDPDGACAGTQPTCTTSGWRCNYPSTVDTDGAGHIVSEIRCDGIDNDCDGQIDESHPDKGDACHDDAPGICRSNGFYACDSGNPTGPVICQINDPGDPATTESCNFKDDDCDGNTDEGALSGNLQSWVDIGGGVQMFTYEASRPDASNATAGAQQAYVCSRAGVKPWTSVKYPQAEAACTAIGARLCTDAEWNRACSVIDRPLAIPQSTTGPDFLVFSEAELYATLVPRSNHTFMPDTAPGYSGFTGLRVSPNVGLPATPPTATEAATVSPELTYTVNFSQTGNHKIWVRMIGAVGNDNSLYLGLDSTTPIQLSQTVTTWTWVTSNTQINVPTTGNHTIRIYMREDGVKVDAFLLSKTTTYNPNTALPSTADGCNWSYASSCDTYAANTCNGNDFDTQTGTAGDQDDILSGGNRVNCYANWGTTTRRVFDMSGNVKEWTKARLPGINGLRGGASNNQADGLTCSFSFAAADDEFFFPNVGFRCCR